MIVGYSLILSIFGFLRTLEATYENPWIEWNSAERERGKKLDIAKRILESGLERLLDTQSFIPSRRVSTGWI